MAAPHRVLRKPIFVFFPPSERFDYGLPSLPAPVRWTPNNMLAHDFILFLETLAQQFRYNKVRRRTQCVRTWGMRSISNGVSTSLRFGADFCLLPTSIFRPLCFVTDRNGRGKHHRRGNGKGQKKGSSSSSTLPESISSTTITIPEYTITSSTSKTSTGKMQNFDTCRLGLYLPYKPHNNNDLVPAHTLVSYSIVHPGTTLAALSYARCVLRTP